MRKNQYQLFSLEKREISFYNLYKRFKSKISLRITDSELKREIFERRKKWLT
jgi:hypothetical protein